MRCTKSARLIRTMLAAAAFSALWAQAPAPSGVLSRFQGTWVEDQSKRKIGSMRSLTFRKGAQGMEELRGSYANPEIQPVRFGDAPYGTGNQLVWKQSGKGRYQRTLLSPAGMVISIRRIEISTDGRSLQEDVETHLANGKVTNATAIYKRASGEGQDLLGVWKPQSLKSDTPATQKIEIAGPALKIANNGGEVLMPFDGKAGNVVGPAVISGSTRALTKTSADSFEVANARNGVATGTIVFVLSADAKTLTETLTNLGPDAGSESSVTVFRKQ